jgi:hypothetical protein
VDVDPEPSSFARRRIGVDAVARTCTPEHLSPAESRERRRKWVEWVKERSL